MKHIALIIGVAIVVAAHTVPVSAQSNRTFVSGQGSDTGTCTIAAPCRSFAYAVTQTNIGGELAVLNTAGYGPVTITKAISIINQDGVEAGITTASAIDGVTINAGLTDVVNLRGLALTGGGVGNNGITVNAAGTVNIQNCAVRGFATGLNVVPGGTGTTNINVSDTVFSGNSNYGALANPSGTGPTNAVFERVLAIGNSQSGIFVRGDSATGAVSATATDSLASGSLFGFWALSVGGKATTIFTIFASKAVENQNGLAANGSTVTMFLAYSTLSGNSSNGFIAVNSALIKSASNNLITDTSNTGSLTPILLQ